jgi:putative acetyltransferase
MMAVAHPKLGVRPFLPADATLLREIFRDSIEELTSDDYNEAQQEAWASTADDVGDFATKLSGQLTLEGSPVGFASLEGKDKIDMLYVHPAATGQGVGAMLVDALEKLAGARGVTKLAVDASDGARGFFEKRGYVAQQRNSMSIGDEWLANTTLHKQLAAKREAS